MVELNGTLSNRKVLLETSELACLKASLLLELPSRIELPAPPGHRSGLIKQTIARVLEEAREPLRVAEIRRACEERLGAPVNRSTVSDCLIRHSNGDRRQFERDGRGAYKWRPLKFSEADQGPRADGRSPAPSRAGSRGDAAQ